MVIYWYLEAINPLGSMNSNFVVLGALANHRLPAWFHRSNGAYWEPIEVILALSWPLWDIVTIGNHREELW